jgi:hypothetical protein
MFKFPIKHGILSAQLISLGFYELCRQNSDGLENANRTFVIFLLTYVKFICDIMCGSKKICIFNGNSIQIFRTREMFCVLLMKVYS